MSRKKVPETYLTDGDAEFSRHLAPLAASDALKFERALGAGNIEKIKEFWIALKGMPRLDSAPTKCPSLAIYQEVSQLIHSRLKFLVDEWIDSGMRDDGVEEPYARELSRERLSELQECLHEIGMGVVYIAHRGGVDTSLRDRDFPELDDPHSKSPLIRDAVRKRQQRSMRLRTHSALKHFFDTDIWSLDWSDEPSRELFAYREAQRLFFVFLSLDGARFRLFRCRKCRCYDFCRPKRDLYKRGWHCMRHMKSAARTASASGARKDERKAWMDCAIEEVRKANAKRVRPASIEVVWLTQKINAHFPPAKWVKRHWVTRHLEDIESGAATERLEQK